MPPKKKGLKLKPNENNNIADIAIDATEISSDAEPQITIQSIVPTTEPLITNNVSSSELPPTIDNDNTQINLENENNDITDMMNNDVTDGDFIPSPIDYMVRQQQLATFQMLSEFLLHRDQENNVKNITEMVNEVRISIDVLAKAVLQLNKTMEKCIPEAQRKKT